MTCVRTELILVSLLFIIATNTLSPPRAGAYPWIHYFEWPLMSRICSAFADAEGSVIVSNGDWRMGPGWPGYTEYTYCTDGILRINEDRIESISCPDDIFVFDYATDSTGRIWVLLATGIDYQKEMILSSNSTETGSDIGYRWGTYPTHPRLQDHRLGYIDGMRLVECPEPTAAIRGELAFMRSDASGRIFVASWDWHDNVLYSFYITWGNPQDVASLKRFRLSGVVPDARSPGYPAYYPEFGPDGIMYLLFYWWLEDSKRYGVLCLNPDTEEWQILSAETSPLLDSKIEYFHVDERNRRWFGTEDGLVLFDGENWARFTTDNSGLPHDLARKIAYDAIDDVHYVISSCKAEDYYEDPEHSYAFSIFSSTGEPLGQSLYHSSIAELHQGAGDVWYLLLRWQDGIFYVYDHTSTREYGIRAWIDSEHLIGAHYIGPTATGRTFLADDGVIMIW
ncbi:MAG: hypothetical protein JW759_01290 [Candidatus Coatesbacteria bacterium]|nr:hypothetical protein [Candidatus Coatesbacteria bacterium]